MAIYKRIPLIFSLLLLNSNFAFAQNPILKALKPDHVNLQYAGSIGYMSIGVGYNFFNEKTALSLHYGFVPESKGGNLNILTTKFEYKPFNINLIKDKLVLKPINLVMFVSYTLGRNFDKKFDPNQYPDGYYFWSTAIKIHAGISSELKFIGDKNSVIKAVSLYAESNTNDLYLISWFENRTTTPFANMFHLGYGIRLHF